MIHNVQQLATVKLNGRDLGLAYRLRYTMAVGDTLREGKTELEIQVTNTWLNRIVTQKDLPVEQRIGDPSSSLDDKRIQAMKHYTQRTICQQRPIAEQGHLMDSGLI